METEVMEFLQLLSGGADMAIIGIAVILLKHDRRIGRLEYSEFGFGKENNDG